MKAGKRLLGRGLRVDRECVKPATERPGQERVDEAVPLQAALARECRRHDIDPEMRLAALPPAPMSCMLRRLVLDAELDRVEFPRQGFGHPIVQRHRPTPSIAHRRACRPGDRSSII